MNVLCIMHTAHLDYEALAVGKCSIVSYTQALI